MDCVIEGGDVKELKLRSAASCVSAWRSCRGDDLSKLVGFGLEFCT